MRLSFCGRVSVGQAVWRESGRYAIRVLAPGLRKQGERAAAFLGLDPDTAHLRFDFAIAVGPNPTTRTIAQTLWAVPSR